MQHDEHIYDCQRHPLIQVLEYRSWLKESIEANTEKWRQEFARCLFGERVREPHKEYIGPDGTEKKEAHAMNALKVEYNGFTGELVKLERKQTEGYTLTPYDNDRHPIFAYDLSIYDSEKGVTHTFDGVKLEDVKFLGGAVSFGG